MFKGAIFDLDGTLLDSMRVWDTIGEDYLLSINIEPKEDLNAVFKSMSMYEAATYYIENYNVPYSHEEIISAVNKLIENFYLNEVTLKPYAKEFLEFLHKKKIKMCIATAGDENLMKETLKRLDILDFFSEIFTCESLNTNKRNALIYEVALKHLNLKKEEVLVFEDAFHAIKTAKENGFKTAAIYEKREENSEKIKELSDYYFEDFRSLKELF